MSRTGLVLGKFLFDKRLVVEEWIEDANGGHLFLYLENDCPFVQDGTRLSIEKREELDRYHKRQLIEGGIPFHLINGNWDNRTSTAIKIIQEMYFNN